jgi:protein-ribulosamine 3-kinase
MWPTIAAAISQHVGLPFSIERCLPVRGGCINSAYRIAGNGALYFVKVNESRGHHMFAAEAAALDAIAKTHTVRVPSVVCHGANEEASWLVLEFIALVPRGDFAVLGRALAGMHRVTGDRFGWHRDNTIGATPQVNTPRADWAEFWRLQRLGYQLELAARNGHGGTLQRKGKRLIDALPALLRDHRPQPSMLHGDLWSGNVGFTGDGAPVIFDPAAYYGDRESDIAMTELFGRLPDAFYAAYEAAFPLDPGYAIRKDLYNLYHLLNHLNLFGRGYLHQAEQMMTRLLALL